MTTPLLVVVLTIAAFVATSTTGKDAVKNANVDLAEELRKSRRESAKLRQDLEMAREETKEIIQRENGKLRADADKLREEADKLREEDDKIKREAGKLRKENKKLRRKVHELHQADSEIKSSLRQRDQNATLELRNIVRNSFRQMDFTSELKTTINKQIKEYLDANRVCVGSQTETYSLDSSSERVAKTIKFEFGQTFQRIPTFIAAISAYSCRVDIDHPFIYVYEFHVTDSSAVVTLSQRYCYYAKVSWIACL